MCDSDRTGHSQIWIGPIDGPAHVLAPSPHEQSRPRFTHDGTAVLFRMDDAFYRVPSSGGTPELAMAATRLDDCAGRLVGVRAVNAADFADEVVVIREPDGREHERLRIDNRFRIESLRCSADGRRIVYEAKLRMEVRAATRAYVLDLDGGEPRLVHEEVTDRLRPTFSRDGRSLVLSSARSGAINLWDVPLDGGEPTQLTFGGGPDLAADVARDGSLLAFHVDSEALPMYAVSHAQPMPRRLTLSLANVTFITPSHDGGAIVYELDDAGTSHIVLRDVATGAERDIATGTTPVFSPHDDEIYYADGNRVLAIPRAGGSPRELATFPPQLRGLAVGEDGAIHAQVFGDRTVQAWLAAPGAPPQLEAPGYVVVIPAPHGGWSAALRAGGTELVAPGHAPGDPANELFAHEFAAWDEDGTSFIWLADDGGVYRRSITSHEQVLLVKLPNAPTWAVPSPDRDTLYYSVAVGRVRREVITNYGARPR